MRASARPTLAATRPAPDPCEGASAQAAQGDGAGQILAELVRQLLRDGRLQAVLPGYRPVGPPIRVLYGQDRRVTPKLKSFLDFCAAAFTEFTLTAR